MGLLFVVVGLPIMALAIGLIAPRAGSMQAPSWVVFLAGFSFSLAGLLILVPREMTRLHGCLGTVFMAVFASIFDWVAFGPGERHFSGGVSIGPMFTSSTSSELGGRIMFGVPAVLMSVWALWVAIVWVRSLFRSAAGSAE
jgi:hypothetical protein